LFHGYTFLNPGQTYFEKKAEIVILFQTAALFFHPDIVRKENFCPGLLLTMVFVQPMVMTGFPTAVWYGQVL